MTTPDDPRNMSADPRTADPDLGAAEFEPTDQSAGSRRPVASDAPLLLDGASELTSRWDRAQSTFVDDPRQAVREARDLVEDVVERLARTFDEERSRLEAAWEAGDEPSTEDLRQALRRYREFFDRFLAA